MGKTEGSIGGSNCSKDPKSTISSWLGRKTRQTFRLAVRISRRKRGRGRHQMKTRPRTRIGRPDTLASSQAPPLMREGGQTPQQAGFTAYTKSRRFVAVEGVGNRPLHLPD